jgi:hypothetical protein
MDATERLFAMPALVPLLSSLGRILQLLRLFEVGFIMPEKARVFSLLSIACR